MSQCLPLVLFPKWELFAELALQLHQPHDKLQIMFLQRFPRLWNLATYIDSQKQTAFVIFCAKRSSLHVLFQLLELNLMLFVCWCVRSPQEVELLGLSKLHKIAIKGFCCDMLILELNRRSWSMGGNSLQMPKPLRLVCGLSIFQVVSSGSEKMASSAPGHWQHLPSNVIND
eukprot:313967-Amphidinium_carterae.1